MNAVKLHKELQKIVEKYCNNCHHTHCKLAPQNKVNPKTTFEKVQHAETRGFFRFCLSKKPYCFIEEKNE